MNATRWLLRNQVMGVALLALFAMFGLGVGQDKRAALPAGQNELPEPPQQNGSWTPPETKLPKNFVTASNSLFQAGMADPRGCEYRLIELDVGYKNTRELIETHGWVLPSSQKDKQRFAVCWNGLVYPVNFVGELADLHADIKSIVKADEETRAASKGKFFRYVLAWGESYTISHEHLAPLQACLLVRLGEGELANAVWAAWVAGMDPNRNDDAIALDDPYLMLAADWLWARFSRATRSHMRGDDGLALLDARALGKMQVDVEAEAERRGFQRKEVTRNGQAIFLPHVDFLSPLPGLLADQERRANALMPGKVSADASKDQRVAALIQELENVAAGEAKYDIVDFARDPIVEGLIKAGDLAVEPLIRCIELDERLTRSVAFDTRRGTRRVMIDSVHEPAYVALCRILETSFGGFIKIG
jgi:hypothetical protein